MMSKKQKAVMVLMIAGVCIIGFALYLRRSNKASVSGSLSSDKTVLEFDLGNGVTMKLVRIPAGTFLMGSPKTELDREDDEGPQRLVTISRPFYIGVTEVTHGQWRAVMGTEPWSEQHWLDADENNAASHITWEEAEQFCRTLSETSGWPVRLPTEAQWEYACRAGSTTRFYYGDDADYSLLWDYAWSQGWGPDYSLDCVRVVGRKKPNAWGLYDMYGNVCEWCSDWKSDSYHGAATRDPAGPSSGWWRVHRGGGWTEPAERSRSAHRDGQVPNAVRDDCGFRVVVVIVGRPERN